MIVSTWVLPFGSLSPSSLSSLSWRVGLEVKQKSPCSLGSIPHAQLHLDNRRVEWKGVRPYNTADKVIEECVKLGLKNQAKAQPRETLLVIGVMCYVRCAMEEFHPVATSVFELGVSHCLQQNIPSYN